MSATLRDVRAFYRFAAAYIASQEAPTNFSGRSTRKTNHSLAPAYVFGILTVMTDGLSPDPALPSRTNVLLVDDDAFILDLYATKFKREGFNVQACLSADQGLEKLRTGFPADVLLFDVMMPQHDGTWFVQTLLAEHLVPRAHLVALTNQAEDADKEKVLPAGCRALHPKSQHDPR